MITRRFLSSQRFFRSWISAGRCCWPASVRVNNGYRAEYGSFGLRNCKNHRESKIYYEKQENHSWSFPDKPKSFDEIYYDFHWFLPFLNYPPKIVKNSSACCIQVSQSDAHFNGASVFFFVFILLLVRLISRTSLNSGSTTAFFMRQGF